MRHLAASSLLLVLFAACSGEGGSNPGDDVGDDGDDSGGDDGPQLDAYVPPQVNCGALDLTNAPAVTIVSGAVTPNPQAGNVTSATYKLTSTKLSNGLNIPISGTAKSRVEIMTGTPTAGAARVSVLLDAMAIGQDIDQEVSGAGLYTIAGSNLTVADGCGGDDEALPVLSYTATANALTLWTVYTVTDPITVDIDIELVFAIE